MSNFSGQKIIVFTGVENSGKSTLSSTLAEKLEVAVVPEYARTYLEKRNGIYNYEDLEEIARLQLMAIKNTTSQDVLVDTALLVLKIWSEEKFNRCSYYILNQLVTFKPTAYIIGDPHIPYEQDALREAPHTEERLRLHQIYLYNLQELNVPFLLVSGTKKERLDQAAQFIKGL